jgi:hypothetical protein
MNIFSNSYAMTNHNLLETKTKKKIAIRKNEEKKMFTEIRLRWNTIV